MRKKSNLLQKLELLYKEIQPKRTSGEKMRLQTDQEFQQNEIKKLNQKHNVEMFNTKLRGGKAFAAEQKIREFKKTLFRSKKLHKANRSSGGKKRFDLKKTIKKAVDNMNQANSEKYGLPPQTIEKKTLSDDVFREIYDFHRIAKVSKDPDRYKRYDLRQDKKFKGKLREPLLVGEKVLVLAKRLKKKRMQLGFYSKVQLKIFLFLIKKTFL